MTTLLGIFGDPVEHSRSPRMHGAAIAVLGLDAVYVPLHVRAEKLPAAVEALSALGFRGVNVTLPHKQTIMALMHELDETAEAIGAVNTVVCEGDALIGRNTDAPGLRRSLEEHGLSLGGMRALVLGAGGAARASVVALAHAGAERIVAASRTVERADQMMRDLASAMRNHASSLESKALASIESALPDMDLVIQATSATLNGGVDAERFAAQLPLEQLPEAAWVVDLVYEPRQTTVLRKASARGLRTVDGLGMLLHQGALSFEHWLGQSPPLGAMREALGFTSK